MNRTSSKSRNAVFVGIRADFNSVFRLDKKLTPQTMARRKFRHSPRFEPQSDRSFNEFLQNQPLQLTNRSELLRLIRGGEDTYLELKVRLSNSERITQSIVALANTNGGTIIFGVNDQLRIEGVSNPEWVQEELVRICRDEIVPSVVPLIDVIAFDSGKRVVAIDVDGKKRPYRTRDGRFYMRFGEEKREVPRSELSGWLDELRPLGYENIPLDGVTEQDFDDALLWSFANAFDDGGSNIYLYQTAEFLKKDLLLAVGSGDEFFPTIAGLLLFGKNEKVAELIPRSRVTVARFSGDNGNAQLIEKLDLQGNLHTLYESMLRFILRYADLSKYKPAKTSAVESPVHSRGNYHLYAVHEAVINALMHRDLALRDIGTRVLIFDSSIEFINPRRTNGFVPPASRAIRYGITHRLNPQIASIFTRREYGVIAPHGGLPMALSQAHKFSGRRAEIYTSNDEFKLKLYSA